MNKKPTKVLVRRCPKIREKFYGTFDIETDGLGGKFLDSVVWDAFGGRRYKTIKDLFVALLFPIAGVKGREFTWFAHNGGKYDFCYIIQDLLDYAIDENIEVKTVLQGSKLIAMRFDGPMGKICIQDSMPLLQTSLKKAAEIFAPDYQKLTGDVDFEGGEIYDPENEKHVAYMMRDGESLYHVMKRFREKNIAAFGTDIAMTSGGTAMKAWLATIPEGIVYRQQLPSVEKFLNRGKQGGFVWPGRTTEKVEDWVTVDRTAAYAAAMKKGGFPTSVAIEVERYIKNKLGFYYLRVKVPEDVPIPMFVNEATGKYETGVFQTYASSELLEFAKAYGVQFKVLKGYVFRRCEDIFEEIINKCEKAEYPEDGTKTTPDTRLPYKYQRNSLFGRFGMNREGKEIYIGREVVLNDDISDKEIDDLLIETPCDPKTGQPLPYQTITSERDGAYIHPEWFWLITERQRIEMFRILCALKPEEQGKADTDSVTMPREAYERLVEDGTLDMNPGYGNYKAEHEWKWLIMVAPKLYGGMDIHGEMHYGSKGISKKLIEAHPEYIAMAAEGKPPTIEIQSVRSPLQALAGRLETFGYTQTRAVSSPQATQKWPYNSETRQYSFPKAYEAVDNRRKVLVDA